MTTETNDAAALLAVIARKGEFITLLADILENQCLAMGAALIEAEIADNGFAGLTWIHNTLAGPGLLPDVEEARRLGGAQAWFDRGVLDREGLKEKLLAAMKPKELPLATAIDVECAGNDLAARCRAAGWVITIDQKSEPPLAAGNHVDVVTVRPTIAAVRAAEKRESA
jgi:hypothetical protein